jgi:O-methyltransferase involved in polyketide biosynthesis
MATQKVHLTQEKETLLPTLYGKALDSRIPDSILGDRWADQVVQQLDYDFARLDLPRGGAISLPVRAKHLDGWTRQFLAAHPRATVLHLGCGLDSRVFRIDPPPSVRWYDVDQAEVIDLRRRVYPERPGTTLLATSLVDLAWLAQIPAGDPVLVVAEGVMIYLPEAEGLALLRAITQRFPAGELIFDAYNRWMLRLTARLPAVRRSGAVLRWAIDDPHTLERQVPRLRLLESVPFLTLPELMSRSARTPLQRTIYGAMGRLKLVQRMVQHLRYRF